MMRLFSMSIEGCLLCCLENSRQVVEYELFRYWLQWVHMAALHGTVEDETQMAVLCVTKESMGAGRSRASPWRFLVMRNAVDKKRR